MNFVELLFVFIIVIRVRASGDKVSRKRKEFCLRYLVDRIRAFRLSERLSPVLYVQLESVIGLQVILM